MKPDALIYIPSTDLRKIKSIVNRFCNEESGKGIRFSFYLQPSGDNGHVLVFQKAIPFDLLCELLFKLDFLSEEKQKVRAYLNIVQKGNGLPAGCMIYVNINNKSEYAAVDANGNLYEDDVETEPYLFKPTGKQANYINCRKVNIPSASHSVNFCVTEEKTNLFKRICNKIQAGLEDTNPYISGCLPVIIALLIFLYSSSLSLRTDDRKLYLYILLISFAIGLLPITKKGYSTRFTVLLFSLMILTYIPNYHFSRHMEKRKAVIEKIWESKRYSHNAKFRFENDETLVIGYRINTKLMHIGDTCILDIGKGLWGMEVCRGVMCNGIQIWEH